MHCWGAVDPNPASLHHESADQRMTWEDDVCLEADSVRRRHEEPSPSSVPDPGSRTGRAPHPRDGGRTSVRIRIPSSSPRRRSHVLSRKIAVLPLQQTGGVQPPCGGRRDPHWSEGDSAANRMRPRPDDGRVEERQKIAFADPALAGLLRIPRWLPRCSLMRPPMRAITLALASRPPLSVHLRVETRLYGY